MRMEEDELAESDEEQPAEAGPEAASPAESLPLAGTLGDGGAELGLRILGRHGGVAPVLSEIEEVAVVVPEGACAMVPNGMRLVIVVLRPGAASLGRLRGNALRRQLSV